MSILPWIRKSWDTGVDRWAFPWGAPLALGLGWEHGRDRDAPGWQGAPHGDGELAQIGAADPSLGRPMPCACKEHPEPPGGIQATDPRRWIHTGHGEYLARILHEHAPQASQTGPSRSLTGLSEKPCQEPSCCAWSTSHGTPGLEHGGIPIETHVSTGFGLGKGRQRHGGGGLWVR